MQQTEGKIIKPCNVCGKEAAASRGGCTNGRCSQCHASHCTPGGATYPGHNPV